MKIKFKRYELVENEVDVEFPLYVEYSDGDNGRWCDKVVKIDEDGRVTSVSITTDRGETEYEFTINDAGLNNALAEYARLERANAASYDELVRKVRTALDKEFSA